MSEKITLDVLTAGVQVYQRAKGHRFSSDDVITAWVAMQACPAPARICDLGCGLGSVLLHLAWSVPAARLAGVEAQDESFALLQRNVAHNGLGDRIAIHHGDLREPEVVAALGGPFDLVTGTPPYFPPGSAGAATDRQRAFARIEYRGGIEDYVAAAARLIAPDGWFVVCGDADAEPRLHAAAAEQGFTVVGRHVVIPRAGRQPLFSVWALRPDAVASPWLDRTYTLRDAAGERTADAGALRAFSGLPETPGPAA